MSLARQIRPRSEGPSKLEQQKALLGGAARTRAPSPKKSKPENSVNAILQNDQPSLEELQKLPVHPMADRFPMWPKDRLKELAADIKVNGLNIPLVVWRKEPMLLDGRNRLAACALEGIQPKVEFFDGDDPRKLIISRNIQTREMTASQKAMLLAMEYPEDGERGRGKKDKGGENADTLGFSRDLLRNARLIVRWAGDMTDRVAVGAVKFDVALKEAQRKKQEAASEEARFARLQEAAPDLARKVLEDDFALDEAEAAHRARLEREAQTREKGKSAVERVRNLTTEIITIGAAIEAGATDLVTEDVIAVVADSLSELQKLAAGQGSGDQ